MTPELKEKWLKALRSGEYKQTGGVLQQGEGASYVGNCCLGVLCRVAEIEYSLNDSLNLVEFEGEDATLNHKQRQKFGITNQQADTLVRMNDGASGELDGCPQTPKSFAEIADWIERNIEPC